MRKAPPKCPDGLTPAGKRAWKALSRLEKQNFATIRRYFPMPLRDFMELPKRLGE